MRIEICLAGVNKSEDQEKELLPSKYDIFYSVIEIPKMLKLIAVCLKIKSGKKSLIFLQLLK